MMLKPLGKIAVGVLKTKRVKEIWTGRKMGAGREMP